MATFTADAARARHAALANMRQELHAPVEALAGYAQILHEEASREGVDDMLADIDRIRTAADDLSRLVERLLDEETARELFEKEDLISTEKSLRHDLRTPINAIKGYSEMLLEDLEDMGAERIRPDLDRLLAESDRLLSQLGTIVSFSQGEMDGAALESATAVAATTMSNLVEGKRPVGEGRVSPEETGHILVVDDIEANRDLLARRLSGDGHRVATATGGEEALAMLQAEEFDLVLLDLMMPGVNGFEVLARMKADSELRSVPVVMVSALDETDSVIRCIEAGADDYLPKPVNPVLLKARIASGLEKKKWADDERQQKRFIRQAFSRFIAPQVVDQLIADPSKLTLGGKRVELTFVFTDLAGFTTLIESSEPSVVLPVLNEYLDALCRIVLEHGGTIDKIVGDALHAFFGAPLEVADHPARAMDCVLALDAYAQAFAETDKARRLRFGHTRIGVHSGTAVVGNFGGESFFDYTAHGDAVNTAARMEGVNKHLGTRVCVTAATASRCPDIRFRPAGTLVLKGKSRGVEAFEPLSPISANSPETKAYLEAFRLMEAEDPGAPAAFRRLAEQFADDPLVTFHAKRLATGETGTTILLKDK